MEENIDKIFDILNMIRTSPQEYATKITQVRDRYRGDIFMGNSKHFKTFEGVKPFDELTDVLRTLKPVQPLKWSFSLHVVADDHAQYLGNTGLAGHIGPNNSRLPQRIQPYAVITGRVNEVIELGSSLSSEILLDLLVDDGLATRKRRHALLDPNYAYVGIAWSMHKVYGFCTVIILADDVSQLIQPTDNLLEVNKAKTATDLNQNFYKILPDPRQHQLRHIVEEQSIVVPNRASVPSQLPSIPLQRPQQSSSCSLM